MKKLCQLLAASAFLIFASHTGAQAGSYADISVVDRTTGKTLQVWHHGGNYYVAGQPNNRYAVKISNRSRGRILTVLSVDGVNAITGETASGNQSGYVLSPRENAQIMGWRKSETDVAAFYFTSVSDSYAGRTGRPSNTGVIGIAVFQEYVEYRPPVRINESYLKDEKMSAQTGSAKEDESENSYDKSVSSGSHAPMSPAPKRAERLGTGHGERLNSSISYTEFRRASSTPSEIITIYYDSYDNLVARGIIPKKRPPVKTSPQAFPGSFVPDPY